MVYGPILYIDRYYYLCITKDFSNYLDIAVKSTLETVSCLRLAQELGYIDKSILDEMYSQAEVLIKRIRAFKKTLK